MPDVVPNGWRVVSAVEAGPEAVRQVFGATGAARQCQCQRYKLAPRESFGGLGADELRLRLNDDCLDDPGPGLVGFIEHEPVAWCGVEPRASYRGLLRSTFTVPWAGRDEDREDPDVWAATCFVTRAGHRRAGHATRLLGAAVSHARANGATTLEGYPIVTSRVIAVELHVGTLGMFARNGFTEVTRPTLRRAVVRLDL